MSSQGHSVQSTPTGGLYTPSSTPSKTPILNDSKYTATPETPDTSAYLNGSVPLTAPGTGTKVIQRCLTDLDDLIVRRKKELSDIQHSGSFRSGIKRKPSDLTNELKPIPIIGLSPPSRKLKDDSEMKRELDIVEEEESHFSETLEELLAHSESHNTTKVTTTTVTHSHLHFSLHEGQHEDGSNGHNASNNHIKHTPEEEELHELRHLNKTNQSKIALLEEKIVQMELHVEANMNGNSQRAKLLAEERTKLQAQRAQLEDELSAANEELQFIRLQQQTKAARVLELENELTLALREVADLKHKVEEDAETIDELKNSRSVFGGEPILKNVSSDDRINSGHHEPSIQPEEITHLQDEVLSLQTELNLLKNEYEKVLIDSGAIAEERANYQLRIAELEYSITQADVKHFELEASAAEANNKLEDLQAKHKDKIEQLRKEIVALMKMTETLKESNDSLQKKYDNLVKGGNVNEEIITELKKQHDKTLHSLADKHSHHIAELKARYEQEKEQQLADALSAVAETAPPTPGPAIVQPVTPIVQMIVAKRPKSNTGFYLGLALVQAAVWVVLLFLAYLYLNHVDMISEYPIRVMPFRVTS